MYRYALFCWEVVHAMCVCWGVCGGMFCCQGSVPPTLLAGTWSAPHHTWPVAVHMYMCMWCMCAYVRGREWTHAYDHSNRHIHILGASCMYVLYYTSARRSLPSFCCCLGVLLAVADSDSCSISAVGDQR